MGRRSREYLPSRGGRVGGGEVRRRRLPKTRRQQLCGPAGPPPPPTEQKTELESFPSLSLHALRHPLPQGTNLEVNKAVRNWTGWFPCLLSLLGLRFLASVEVGLPEIAFPRWLPSVNVSLLIGKFMSCPTADVAACVDGIIWVDGWILTSLTRCLSWGVCGCACLLILSLETCHKNCTVVQ